RGFGVGSTDWPRYPALSEAEVVIHADGSVEVRTGSQDIGTGQRTVMGTIAARGLGVPLDRVKVRIGSSTLPTAPGSGGSVTSSNTAPSMAEAATDAKNQFLSAVADQLGEDASDLDVVDDQVLIKGRPAMSFRDACRRMGRDHLTGRGARTRDSVRNDDPNDGHSMGVQFVDLRVDTETGLIKVDRIVAIQSCGMVVNRKTAESQIIGAVIQGLSYALFEEKVLDRNTGAMVNPNLEWYRIAGAADMPHIEPVLWSEGQTGVRPLGEPPTIPTSGAIACAVFNAIGAPVRDLPLRPDRVLAACKGGAS
ncbi:MAG: xanthine dehydrogenase family protein molybdopterin-binding subunit, partial [Phycisphaerales bacterium]|nr:xanthine dehydrogenase family protein molybdopterin-binding subunit [Phycisphaerales bacterium]